jgi:predicted AAA+ superfamily ATPase
MAGRFELTRLGHWPWSEMCRAFGLTLDQYVFFGGYPGAAPLVNDQKRWASYVMDALVEPTISRDVLMMSPVKKPALLRRLFDLTCTYSGQLLSYQKMLGQLDDAGNTTTLAHYLDLLEGAGMVCGLPKYMGSAVRQRASSPKLQVMNNALMSAYYILQGNSYEQLQQPNLWGRWVESAVGTHLLTKHLEHSSHHPQIFYWNNGQQEVDYVVSAGKELWAYEVKSGRQQGQVSGLNGFVKHFKEAKPMIVGTGGLPLGEFMA